MLALFDDTPPPLLRPGLPPMNSGKPQLLDMLKGSPRRRVLWEERILELGPAASELSEARPSRNTYRRLRRGRPSARPDLSSVLLRQHFRKRGLFGTPSTPPRDTPTARDEQERSPWTA